MSGGVYLGYAPLIFRFFSPRRGLLIVAHVEGTAEHIAHVPQAILPPSSVLLKSPPRPPARARRTSLALMAIAVAGLSIMSAPAPLALWSLSALLSLVEVRSMLCFLVVAATILVLAYLTNPSETSFRQFLTEQSFRLHLSRLDDVQDERCSDLDNPGYASSRRSTSSLSRHTPVENVTPPFHFANRASVSLRTPKHIFRSFGVLTIAAVIPTGRRKLSHTSDDPSLSDAPVRHHKMVDSWFVGMFGRWWWAAPIDAWWKESYIMARDEEVAKSGVLEIKALDRAKSISDLSPPYNNDLENTDERSKDKRINHSSRRSSTPPPLPKSASLPLHSKRLSPPQADRQRSRSPANHQSVAPVIPDPILPVPVTAAGTTPTLSRSPSTLFDHTPVIAEILRQISSSQSNVQDLRSQLSDFQTGAATTRDNLNQELDLQRERKRMDEASRSELKSRMKQLEEAKRAAESSKREVEKKLKAAQNAQAQAESRIDRLVREVAVMEQRISDDETKAMDSAIETSALELELLRNLEMKKAEIKVAEVVVSELGHRARELEERIAAETTKLQKAKEDAEMRRQDRNFSPLHVITPPDMNIWPHLPEVLYTPSDPIGPVATTISLAPPGLMNASFTPIAPRPSVSLQALLGKSTTKVEPKLNGYGSYDDELVQLDKPPTHTAFAPFGDSPRSPQAGFLSPVGSSLIPNSLIQSLDIDQSANLNDSNPDPRYFGISADQTFDREGLPSPTSTPLSPEGSAFDEADTSEGRPSLKTRNFFTRMDMQRAIFPNREPQESAALSDPAPLTASTIQKPNATRRWFSKEKKGLNPDAKEFSLSKDKERTLSLLLSRSRLNRGRSMDALDHDGVTAGSEVVGLNPSFSSLSSFFTTSRAFAPSPEEREALARGLGAGSSNNSLERLASLSDVGSIPSSPNHAHSVVNQQNHRSKGLPNMAASGSSMWMRKFLPLQRFQTNFSPFADDDLPVSNKASAAVGESIRPAELKDDTK